MNGKAQFCRQHSVAWWVGRFQYGPLSDPQRDELHLRMVRDVTFEKQFIEELKASNEAERCVRHYYAGLDPAQRKAQVDRDMAETCRMK